MGVALGPQHPHWTHLDAVSNVPIRLFFFYSILPDSCQNRLIRVETGADTVWFLPKWPPKQIDTAWFWPLKQAEMGLVRGKKKKKKKEEEDEKTEKWLELRRGEEEE